MLSPRNCPFCGQPPVIRVPSDASSSIKSRLVACESRSCDARPSVLGINRTIAVQRWNGPDPVEQVELRLNALFQMPGTSGAWRLDRFCEEPNTGLCILMPVDPPRGRGVVLPCDWLEQMLRTGAASEAR